jgi:CTP synthase (UTP-ammonia lyase)
MHYKSRIEIRVNPDTGLVEIVEIGSSFFIVQYHPEYKSTVANPHPIFCEFCSCCRKRTKKIISVHQKIVKSNFLSGNDNQ